MKMQATAAIPFAAALLMVVTASTAHAQTVATGRLSAYQAGSTLLRPPVVTLPRTAQSTYAAPQTPVQPAPELPPRDITPLPASPACDAVPHVPIEAIPIRPAMVTYRPLVPLVAMPRTYRVGRGILGQPKLYVPGQPVRNAFRYLTP